jgi:argininosuccinate lyase
MPLWSGRFEGGLDPAAWELNASLPVDQRMAGQDVRGSLAWAAALVKAGVLSPQEGDQIRQGLEGIAAEFGAGLFEFKPGDEDIHTAVERRLVELIGPLGGKLHTGRSRNDQVAADFRLWLMDQIPLLVEEVIGLQRALLGRAEADFGLLMPGYTHLQRAQPVLLSHWWLAHFWPLQRDRRRLEQVAARCGICPLGSGALAGAPFPINRQELAESLGFTGASPNSIDGVSDRDFASGFLYAAALTGVHLSRLAEAMALFCSAEFGFFELSDAYSTGSSLMPQKKNPDVFELARGRAGTLVGLLTGLLTTLKGLPSAYDKDLQEDKEAVFRAYDILGGLLQVLRGAIETLSVRGEALEAGIEPTMMATDLADYLVEKGVPFREAHGLAAQVVRIAIDQKTRLDELPLETFRQASPAFEADLYAVFDPHRSVARRRAYGGTAPEAVRIQIDEARRVI